MGGGPQGGITSAGGSQTAGNPAGGNSLAGSLAGGNPAGGNSTAGNPAGGGPQAGTVAGGSRTGGVAMGGIIAGGIIAGGGPAGGSSAGGIPAGGSPSGGKPAGGSSAGGNSAGGSSAGGTVVVIDDPTCSSFAVPRTVKLTPEDPGAKTMLALMSQNDKITMLSGDKVTNWNGDTAFRSLGVAGAGVTVFPMRDGPRGVRNCSGEIGTTWAVAEARAASFDLDLEYQVGKYQGLDMRAAKDDLALAPTVNLLRHPRWARAQETYGEDPVLQGEMGAAYVRGMQQEGNTAACPKHFLGNDTDDNRGTADPIYDEQTLRENYARVFEIVVKKGDPACIMAAYNKVNDTHCTENSHILTDILRTDWGWAGFVVSDWDASVAGDGYQSINAGLDLEMPDPRAFTTLAGDLAAGRTTTATLEQSVRRILNARIKFNDFDPTYQAATKISGHATDTANVSLAERTELEGAVLLKNDGVLPLGANVKTIAIVGPDNNLPAMPQNGVPGSCSGLGDRGSSQTSPPHVISYFQGLTNHAGGVSIKQSADSSAAAGADVVIIPIAMAHEDEGENYGGGHDRQNMTLDGPHPIHWTTKPAAFIAQVAKVNPNIIVLLNVGSAIIVEDWVASARAIVQTFYPGQEGGTALAKLLFGDVNFSGKLPFTVGQNESDYPPFGNSGGARFNVDYLHGYRHFEKNTKPVRYWFGYGQSYTTFQYSNLQVLCSKVSSTGRLNAQVTVQNTGKVAGTEVVEVYIGYPNTTARRPVKELKAFTRATLAPGASQVLQLSVPAQDMAYWGTNGWTVEKVAHTLLVGPSADPTTLLSATFTIQ
jgi:beta-glucosidase